MRVALHPPPKQPSGSEAAKTLLDPAGPAVLLGGQAGRLPRPLVPGRTTLFGPRGGCLAPDGGPLWIADTGHHRLLGWRRRPEHDSSPADWVIGQTDFLHEGRNGRRPPDGASLNVPTGIAFCGRGLAVADAWNHRVLIWRELPEDSGVPADLVLGQKDFAGAEANRGRSVAAADTLNWCYGVFEWENRLYVADTGNRRVLIWDAPPVENGQPADAVLGQATMTGRDENAGQSPDAGSMRWPHQITVCLGRLGVADGGNNRVMLWRGARPESGQPADVLLGQRDPGQVDHNQGLYWPDAGSLNMPYGVTAADDLLIVADTANSRLLGWPGAAGETGAPASCLAGQPNFMSKGDNRWQPAVRDSLCWPYAVAATARTLVIADSGNNRVMLWDLAG